MKRKRVYLRKNKKMPDLTAMHTDELLSELDQYMLQQEVADVIEELKFRVIKENDSDDIEYQSIYAWRRGLRPLHAPRV